MINLYKASGKFKINPSIGSKDNCNLTDSMADGQDDSS